MQVVVTASDVKNKLGDLFDAVEKDEAASVLIERNRRPVAMLLNAEVAEKVILGAYAQGVLPRSVAMQQLGMDWYGDLLQRMNTLGIKHPMASAADAQVMKQAADDVLSLLDPRAPALLAPSARGDDEREGPNCSSRHGAIDYAGPRGCAGDTPRFRR